MEKAHLKQEKWVIERMVEIDGQQSQLLIDLSFNNINGQFKITEALTTKQVSRNKDVRTAVCQQLSQMKEEAMVKALELRDKWVEANPPEDSISFPDSEDNEDADLVTEKSDPAFSDEINGDGTGDTLPEFTGEDEQEAPQLSLSAKPKKNSRKSNAKEVSMEETEGIPADAENTEQQEEVW